MIDSPARFDVERSANNHFAWLRTQMSLQRTLMAAVRTAVSLIGFGFTVAQFFQRIQGTLSDDVRRLGPSAPRNFGLVLIGAGIVSLAIFTWQYYSANKYMHSALYKDIAGSGERSMNNSSYIVSFAVILIGIAAFVMILARF